MIKLKKSAIKNQSINLSPNVVVKDKQQQNKLSTKKSDNKKISLGDNEYKLLQFIISEIQKPTRFYMFKSRWIEFVIEDLIKLIPEFTHKQLNESFKALVKHKIISIIKIREYDKRITLISIRKLQK